MSPASAVDTPITYFLYLKTHKVTGKKYLGRTQRDPFLYLGSGTYWLRHLEKHGKDVETIILLKTQNFQELCDTGIFFSKLFNIVESKEFANLCEEHGQGVIGYKHNEETLKKISIASSINNRKRQYSPETKLKISKAMSRENHPNYGKRGIQRSPETKSKMSVRAKMRKLTECPHCSKIMSRSANRWHFDNCREKQ